MSNNPNKPQEFDAVLGGKAPPPVEGVVLGGLEGVKHRLTSTVVEARVTALSDALSYGEAGLDLVIGALNDSSQQVQRSASRLLRDQGGDIGKQALLKYDIFSGDVYFNLPPATVVSYADLIAGKETLEKRQP